MKFFYHQCLGWNERQLFIPPRKRSWQLPEVLSQKEVERLLLAATTQRDRCLLMTAYATGLRVSELVRLKVSAIDSHRMMVRVEQGKGRKDRYTILSQRLLCELRSYWKEHRSPTYLFPNRKGTPISIDYAQKTYNRAKLRAGIEKGHGIHTLRHCFATHLLEAGVDLRTIQTLLGHTSLLSTERYLQIRQHRITIMANPLDLLRLPD
jgi:site-specific recombinase XerD